MLWDIFCRVIDNFGDIGVSWRLCADLAARGHSLRLWVDDGSALPWMAPGALEGNWPRIRVLQWEQSVDSAALDSLPPADVWIETFGCEIPDAFVAHFAQQLEQQSATRSATKASIAISTPTPKPPVWLNLEYLSAEPYVERSHALPSPVMRGPARGWTKFFYYPGFTARTGGLLREPSITLDRPTQDAAPRAAFFAQHAVSWQDAYTVSLFCYEPPLLGALLNQWAAAAAPVHLLVTQGRASAAVRELVGEQMQLGHLRISYLPLLTQTDYDGLLRACDLNFVRGEDSVLRALWAGQPFVWHIYPQHDQAHAAKLEAFMECLQFSAPVRTLHRAWNGLLPATQMASALVALQPRALPQWQSEARAARTCLCELDDLCTQLVQFVRNKQ